MEARLQRRIQRYGWDRAAADYAAFWSRQIAPAQEKLLEMAALRPAPLTPLVALITGHWFRSSSPASISGFSESCAAVG